MLTVEAPINHLSLGNCSVAILREFWKKKIDINLIPIGPYDVGAFDKYEPEFLAWLKESSKGLSRFSKNDDYLKLWHINGSHSRIGKRNFLYTFHELNKLTAAETNICAQYDKVFVPCEWNKEIFQNNGLTNVDSVPLGFDSVHFKQLKGRHYDQNLTCWSIYGKFEKRKAHLEAIKGWIELYGNKPNHVLHLSLSNPFLQRGEEIKIILNQLGLPAIPHYINFLGFSSLNSEYNKVLNVADIVIDMSRGESFSLPSFQAVALGKHAVLHNATGIKQWANAQNAVLVESSGEIEPWDGRFFGPGQDFNQGNYYDWNMDQYKDALKKAFTRSTFDRENKEGLKLAETFTWQKCAEGILWQVL